MSSEFEPYIDFWLEGQRQGFAGNLPRIKLQNGSKMVALYKHPLLYVDNWYGSDLGGGQTMLYLLSETWKSDNPLQIVGTPIARLGYSGRILRRIDNQELEDLCRATLLNDRLREKINQLSLHSFQSEIIWVLLKDALSQVSRERPFRGPEYYDYGWNKMPEIRYMSEESGGISRTVGKEIIDIGRRGVFLGNYDFILIKKNLEDRLIQKNLVH